MQSITELPFTERRHIAVLSNDDYERNLRLYAPFKYGDIILEAIPLLVPGGIRIRIAAKLGSTIAMDKANQAYKKYAGRDRSLIQAVPLREANRFRFLSGSAEVGRAYAANPLCDDTYYSVDTYNDDMIDHKLSELERILNGLGAKRYQISFQSDELDGARASLGIKERRFFKKGAAASVEAEFHRARARRFERGGTSQGRDPCLPSNLVWLDREPSWQALVESRLHYGRENFDLRVTLDRDMRMSSKVMGDLKLLRLDMEASVERKSNVTLSVSGTF